MKKVKFIYAGEKVNGGQALADAYNKLQEALGSKLRIDYKKTYKKTGVYFGNKELVI